MRHRPTRFAADHAQRVLCRNRIDLVNHTIDVEGQLVAQCRRLRVKGHQAVGPENGLGVSGHRKTPVFQGP